MATIRKLKSGSWNVQIRVKGLPNQSKTFKSKLEADAWASLVEWEASQRALPRKQKLFDIGLAYREAVLSGRGSYSHALSRLNTFKKYLDYPVTEITPRVLNEFKHFRLAHVSADTVIADLQLVSRIYKWANQELIIECANPVEGIALPKANKPRNRIIEPEELKLLIANAPEDMGAIFELAYETAMRRAEIVNLRVKDLFLDQRLLNVLDGKTGDRLVPLTYRAVDILRAFSEGKKPEQMVFAVEPRSVTQGFRRARQRAQLDTDIKFHQLRHTRCTIVARKGFNNAQIMAVTGHTDVRSVQRYTHLSAIDVLDLI